MRNGRCYSEELCGICKELINSYDKPINDIEICNLYFLNIFFITFFTLKILVFHVLASWKKFCKWSQFAHFIRINPRLIWGLRIYGERLLLSVHIRWFAERERKWIGNELVSSSRNIYYACISKRLDNIKNL